MINDPDVTSGEFCHLDFARLPIGSQLGGQVIWI